MLTDGTSDQLGIHATSMSGLDDFPVFLLLLLHIAWAGGQHDEINVCMTGTIKWTRANPEGRPRPLPFVLLTNDFSSSLNQARTAWVCQHLVSISIFFFFAQHDDLNVPSSKGGYPGNGPPWADQTAFSTVPARQPSPSKRRPWATQKSCNLNATLLHPMLLALNWRWFIWKHIKRCTLRSFHDAIIKFTEEMWRASSWLKSSRGNMALPTFTFGRHQ